jgi:hypothetical protein
METGWTCWFLTKPVNRPVPYEPEWFCISYPKIPENNLIHLGVVWETGTMCPFGHVMRKGKFPVFSSGRGRYESTDGGGGAPSCCGRRAPHRGGRRLPATARDDGWRASVGACGALAEASLIHASRSPGRHQPPLLHATSWPRHSILRQCGYYYSAVCTSALVSSLPNCWSALLLNMASGELLSFHVLSVVYEPAVNCWLVKFSV